MTQLEHDRSAGGGYREVQASEEFQGLRRTLRRFVFPATALFLAWYLLYVLLTAYARGFMAQKVLGEINVAYVLGLLQFVSTFVIAWVYARYAATHFDPTADRLRARIEGSADGAHPSGSADRTATDAGSEAVR